MKRGLAIVFLVIILILPSVVVSNPVAAACTVEYVIIQPEVVQAPSGELFNVNIQIPSGFNTLIFDQGFQYLIFGTDVDQWQGEGTWYAICPDPVPVAIRIARGKVVWDMRLGEPVLLSGTPAEEPAQGETASALECGAESDVVQPASTVKLPDQRTRAFNVPLPLVFNALIFDGQEISGGPRILRIFGQTVTEWTYGSGSWWAVCGDPVEIATRMDQEAQSRGQPQALIWDMRTGVRLK